MLSDESWPYKRSICLIQCPFRTSKNWPYTQKVPISLDLTSGMHCIEKAPSVHSYLNADSICREMFPPKRQSRREISFGHQRHLRPLRYALFSVERRTCPLPDKCFLEIPVKPDTKLRRVSFWELPENCLIFRSFGQSTLILRQKGAIELHE